MKILAFESTCDETAVAVVEDGRKILTDQILSQASLHAVYGGVVPEIASRCHIEAISILSERAIKAARAKGANVSRDDFVFPNWDPTRDYANEDYAALRSR